MKNKKNDIKRIKYIITAILLLSIVTTVNVYAQKIEDGKFRGALHDSTNAAIPYPVRNDTAAVYDEIVTIRYSRIKKGTFPLWLKVSKEGVWPYFEKLGARIIGAWQVVTPDGIPGATQASNDYDEVYLLTRYANFEHWKATRDPVKLGGNGPDYQKCVWALKIRDSISYESTVKFLKGSLAPDIPYFLPGTGETYKMVEGEP